MMRALVTALRTLTVLPVPGRDTERFENSLFFFPLAGLIIGAAFGGVFWFFRSYTAGMEPVACLALLFVPVALSGGLHIDGLADVCDAFGGGRDRAARLKILKDSRLGTFGVIAVVFDLALKYVLVLYCYNNGLALIIPLGFILSRSAGTLFMLVFPRVQGRVSLAAPFIKKSGYIPWLMAEFIVLAVLPGLWLPWLPVLISCGSAVLAIVFFGIVCLAKLGGISGDCIGFSIELFEAVFVLAAAGLWAVFA